MSGKFILKRITLLERYGGWALIGLFVFIPVAIWFGINPINEDFTSWSRSMASLGKLCGIVGFIMFAINFLLSTRAKWLEKFFVGLNSVYKTHHILGGLALVFLLFHPLFLALKYIEWTSLASFQEAAKFLLPRMVDFSASQSAIQEDLSMIAGSLAFFGMVVLLFITFFVNLQYKIWLLTHKFLGVAFVFAGLHVIFISSDVSRSKLLLAYTLVWFVIGLVSYLYKTIAGNIVIRREEYIVSGVKVSNSVIGLNLTPKNRPMSLKPGQFLFVSFVSPSKVVDKESHPFSVASISDDGGMVLYIKSLGDYTSHLENIEVGVIAKIEGAYGSFGKVSGINKPQVWIAGGIGITPFLSLAQALNESSPSVRMFYTVEDRSQFVGQDMLENVMKNKSDFRLDNYVTKEHGGYITAKYIQNVAGDLSRNEFFICGPSGMMSSLRKQLISAGVKKNNIHTEEFDL